MLDDALSVLEYLLGCSVHRSSEERLWDFYGWREFIHRFYLVLDQGHLELAQLLEVTCVVVAINVERGEPGVPALLGDGDLLGLDGIAEAEVG